MCNNCINTPTTPGTPLFGEATKTLAENEELKKQVSALTQALDTQNRDNQPYIKELEDRLRQSTHIINWATSLVPDDAQNWHAQASGFLNSKSNATGGDKPEQEQ